MKDLIQSLEKFYKWWVKGISYLLPAKLYKKLQRKQHYLVVEADNQKLYLKYSINNTDYPVREWTLDIDDEQYTHQINSEIRQSIPGNTTTILRVTDKSVLQRDVVLPLAASNNLKEILGFEMDRLTPFKAEQVYFDWEIKNKDAQQQKINLKLYVVPRNSLDRLMKKLKSLGITPRVITAGDNILNPGINFTPDSYGLIHVKNYSIKNMGLPAMAVIMFIAMLYAPIIYQSYKLDSLKAEVQSLKEQAMDNQALVLERDNIISRASFLDEQRHMRSSILDLIYELTIILPDNTWINRLITDDDEIQIYGESAAAASIIEMLEESEYFSNVQFKAPVTKNNNTGSERFHISMNLTTQGLL